MNIDLSDKAFWDYVEQACYSKTGLEVWQECRRLAEWLERHAFEAGLHANPYSDKWVNPKEIEELWQAYQEPNHGSKTHQQSLPQSQTQTQPFQPKAAGRDGPKV